ncbi:MAG: TetR/AcrR family transcriptional regulator [Hamadaea sp.]|uniref:TetR/AcrR family transcriptional regulator n=1 Tax=Hamadaea sp. TaxID=2024425 RepID=UPI001842C81C|nr:TetR/AcrR family transcriptional regulator [Hamadaea sp.]NUR69634.1 TetR/AcrR family transcriptional regulator [Hamadaea sp.]NUT23340.1 TetR/AcrR family transcriptional regulator [Hamadaea sp.]
MSQPRRSPRAEDRKRDPERTRERILDAALTEFGEHGYAGARISAIASRAGVNQQLISYYFDGKAGLYQAVVGRWPELSGPSNQPGMPIHEVVGNFLRMGMENRAWTRLLAWQGLTGDGDEPARDSAEGSGDPYFEAIVEDVRRRQRDGEIAADLDPAYVLLVMFSATMAPVLLPQITQQLTGLRADTPEFLTAYTEQLRRIVEHLRG